MTATEKALFFIQSFPESGWIKVDNQPYHIEVDFELRNDWLSNEEETLLRKLGAVNMFGYEYDFMSKTYSYNDNLNTACAGTGCFKFTDDIFGGHITDNSFNSNQGNDDNLPQANR